MRSKKSEELHIQTNMLPLPSLEIQVYGEGTWELVFNEVEKILSRYSEKNTQIHATVYRYGTMSYNFHNELDWSEFLIVADSSKAGTLSKVLSALQSTLTHMSSKGIRARYSESVSPSNGEARYHIEDGQLWMPEDATTWFTRDAEVDESPQVAALNPEAIEEDIDDDGDEPSSSREQYPTRFRSARSDASVSKITSEIERVFGLPEGCVSLCLPDGKPIRKNASIGTLRQRWDE